MEVAPGELFDLQDHIVQKIVAGIAPNVRKTELRNALRKRPDNFTAYDYALKAMQIINSLDQQTFLRAREFLDKATAEDQHFAMPVACLASLSTPKIVLNPSAIAIRIRIKMTMALSSSRAARRFIASPRDANITCRASAR